MFLFISRTTTVPNHLSRFILTGKSKPEDIFPKYILKSLNLSCFGFHLLFNLCPPIGIILTPHIVTLPENDFGLSFTKFSLPKVFIIISYRLLPSKILKLWSHVFVALIFSITAFLIFLFDDKINWIYGINLGIGSALGGWITSRWSYNKSDFTMKIILSVIIIAMSIKLWFF